MDGVEERARMLSEDFEVYDDRQARRPLKYAALVVAALLGAVALSIWSPRLGRPSQPAAHPAENAGIFLAETKEEDKAKKEKEEEEDEAEEEPAMSIEEVKAMLDEDLAKAKEEEDEARAKSKEDMDKYKAKQKQATSKKEEAEKEAADSKDKKASAKKDLETAQKLRREAKENVTRADQMAEKGARDAKKASADLKSAKADVAKAEKGVDKANEAVKSAQEQLDAAKAVEEKALETAAAQRACVDLPGVQLQEPEGGKSDFEPIIVDKETGTAEQCADWCLKNEGCAQAIFAEGDKSCSLFEQSTTDVVAFVDDFTSTLCGPADQQEDLESQKQVALSHQPNIPDVVECSWDGEDCTGTKCCNDEECDWEFNECKPYSCFGSGEEASCMSACYSDQCENLGEGRETREIEPAEEGVLTQGTSLYCFMVVVWSKPEAELANNAKDKGAGIYQCDEGEVIEGQETEQTEWKTYLNADMFIDAWKQVQEGGKYAAHDWTVKVDADAVFFPETLKQHIGKLRTPKGSRVYLRNIESKFQFFGAVEVMTREALTLYFEKGWVCEAKDHGKQGEDYFMKHCLDAIGCDHQTDFDLLGDQSADPSTTTLDCSNGWRVAYHWARTVDDWNKCHDDASSAQASQ